VKKTHCLFIVAASVVLFGFGCGKGSDSEISVQSAPVHIKVGHVGHDHQLALFVAADNAERFAGATGISLRAVRDRELYELFDGDRKLADVEIVLVGGGSKMPTALAQEIIDIGFGGVVPSLAAADKGAPIKLIAPLHSKGDMLVVRPDFPAATWEEFLRTIRESEVPVRIGYKAPIAVAKTVFEEALRHEGIIFGGNLSKAGMQVHMINVKGGGKLNVALAAGLVDGYVGNNPFPAIGLEKKLLKVVCDLDELPPGTLRDHPCCCIAANTKALEGKGDVIEALLVLFWQATELINADLNVAVASATRWIGTTEEVERSSIPTSGYSMDPSPEWHGRMAVWLEIMQGLEVFTGELQKATGAEAARSTYDLSLLEKAKERLGE